MITSLLLSNVRHRAMRTPVGPLRTRLIHIRPSYWTLFRSFEIILERGVAHWIRLQIQCSIPEVADLFGRRVFLQKIKNASEPQIQFVVSIQTQLSKEWKFYRKRFT